MNILLINHYAGSTIHGMEFRPFYLAREWVRLGHSVTILAGSYSHIRGVQPNFDGNFFDQIIEGITYRWFKTPSYKGNGFGRILSMLRFLWVLTKNAHRISDEFEPDLVIASSTYPMDIWPARMIANRSRAKLVFEVHDLWPLSPMELGGMSKWHPFIVWVQLAEDYAYRHATKVVSMLPKALEYMKSRGMNPDKFCHVPNGIDPEEWESPESIPFEVTQVLEHLRGTGRAIIGYAGTHGLANALDTVLDAAKLLSGEAEFLLVGTGPDRQRLLERVRMEAIENVTMLDAIPKRSIPSLLKQIDIAYIGWHPNPLYRFGISPNKLMDYMMAGRPVIHSVSAGNDPVAEAGCGVTVRPSDPIAIAHAVNILLSKSKPELDAMGRAGRDFIIANQTYPVLAKRFIEYVQQSKDMI